VTVAPPTEFALLVLLAFVPVFALSVAAQAAPKVARASKLSRAKVRRIEVPPVFLETQSLI
jgi:hypothetical protein